MTLRPTWMEVRLDHIRANYRAIEAHVLKANEGASPKPRVFGVIKANGYNLGAVQVAWALKQEGADFFIVATPDEGLELREGGVADPVLILGASPYEAAAEYVRHGIRASLTDVGMAQALSGAAEAQGKKAFVHIKVDTGMGRIGFHPEEAPDRVAEIAALPGVVVEGIFTHFATSDEADLAYTERQHGAFVKTLEAIKARGVHIPISHCCNSGGTVSRPEWAMEGVRPGQLVVGLYPSPDVPRTIPLLPGFSFKTTVSAVRKEGPGEGISYGLTYTTDGEKTLAVLPVGYADGFSRELSNKAPVLIRGKRCPIVGRICMDQCMADVSELPEVAVGDEVVIIGPQGREEISVYEYAENLNPIVATIGARISARVPRRYVDEG